MFGAKVWKWMNLKTRDYGYQAKKPPSHYLANIAYKWTTVPVDEMISEMQGQINTLTANNIHLHMKLTVAEHMLQRTKNELRDLKGHS